MGRHQGTRIERQGEQERDSARDGDALDDAGEDSPLFRASGVFRPGSQTGQKPERLLPLRMTVTSICGLPADDVPSKGYSALNSLSTRRAVARTALLRSRVRRRTASNARL
jgi:hypothetical protein